MRILKPKLILTLIILTVSILTIVNLSKINDTNEGSTQIKNKVPIVSATAPRTVINDTNMGISDWETMKATYSWITGDGTKLQPYIIDNVTIDGGQAGDCLKILDSQKFFEIKNSTFHNAGAAVNAGIRLVNVSNGKIFSNNISNNEDFGIYLEQDCFNNSIYENTLYNNDFYGIRSYTNSNYNNISSNIITGSDYGIYVRENNNTRITGNTITDNIFYGINLRDTRFNVVKSNTVKGNMYGISINNGGSNNTILSNLIKNNTINGIQVSFSSNNNTFIDNYVYLNEEEQVDIQHADCNDNRFEYNNLISKQGKFISDAGTNTNINNNTQLLSLPSLDIGHQETHTNKIHYVIINITSPLGFKLFMISLRAWWDSSELLSSNIAELSDGKYNLSLPLFDNNHATLSIIAESETHASKTYSVELFNYNPDPPDANDDDDDNNENSNNSLDEILIMYIMIGFIINGILIMIGVVFFIKSKSK